MYWFIYLLPPQTETICYFFLIFLCLHCDSSSCCIEFGLKKPKQTQIKSLTAEWYKRIRIWRDDAFSCFLFRLCDYHTLIFLRTLLGNPNSTCPKFQLWIYIWRFCNILQKALFFSTLTKSSSDFFFYISYSISMYIQYIFVKDLFLIEGTEERIFIPHVLCLHSELFSHVCGFLFQRSSPWNRWKAMVFV